MEFREVIQAVICGGSCGGDSVRRGQIILYRLLMSLRLTKKSSKLCDQSGVLTVQLLKLKHDYY